MKSNVYTRTGDGGQTSLVGGRRVDKDCARLESYGTIDELNSHIGLLISLLHAEQQPDLHPDSALDLQVLQQVQNDLFVLGSYLATPLTTPLRPSSIVTEAMTLSLERHIDRTDVALPPLHAFVLPGGSMAGAQCHVCRTVCRRAERRILTLSRQADIDPRVVTYVNRLSDLLFVLARKININAQKDEIFWNNTCRNE